MLSHESHITLDWEDTVQYGIEQTDDRYRTAYPVDNRAVAMQDQDWKRAGVDKVAPIIRVQAKMRPKKSYPESN